MDQLKSAAVANVYTSPINDVWSTVKNTVVEKNPHDLGTEIGLTHFLDIFSAN